jgi:hypothetical protein
MSAAQGSITYKSREAGQKVTGATFLNVVGDDELVAAKNIIAGFQTGSVWSACNVRDAFEPGTGAAIAHCKEARMVFKTSAGNLFTMHIPFVAADTKDTDLRDRFCSVAGDEGALNYCDAAGNKLVSLIKCSFVNPVP